MAIEINNLAFAYPQNPSKRVLNIPSWQVASAEQLFLQGASGSGKSTLLNLLSGMLPCQQGEIRILGERLDHMNGHQRDRFRANHIGYVFQQFNLIPYLNAVENIQLAAHFNSLASRANTGKRIDSILDSLSIPGGERTGAVENLSVGQRQRIAIARAMINQPELLIADEPTSSLDHDNRDQFLALLKAVVQEQGSTLIFVSHDSSLASHFNRHDSLPSINQVGQA